MACVNLKPLKTFELLGETVEIVVTGAMTGKHGSMVIETSPPGGGPPPHVHSNEDETLIVLKGEFEVLFSEQWHKMRVGEVAFLPRGSVHTFRNGGTKPERWPSLSTLRDSRNSLASWPRGSMPATSASESFKPVGGTVLRSCRRMRVSTRDQPACRREFYPEVDAWGGWMARSVLRADSAESAQRLAKNVHSS